MKIISRMPNPNSKMKMSQLIMNNKINWNSKKQFSLIRIRRKFDI